MKLSFRQAIEEIPRTYNGVLSVTSILSVLEDPFYIRKWKESAEDPSVVDLTISNARKRGVYVHLVASEYYKRSLLDTSIEALREYQSRYGLPEPDSKVMPFLMGFNSFVSKQTLVPVTVEKHFISKSLGFAGKPDFIGMHEGKLTLLDWKTSASAKLDEESLFRYWLQLSAYAALWNSVNPENLIKKLMIVVLTNARKSGLGEIYIEDSSLFIQQHFLQFLECKEMFLKLWKLSPNYPQVREILNSPQELAME